MTGLSFAAALVGAKKPSTKDAGATTGIPVATPSSENTVPSTPPAAPSVRKNAWSVPVVAAPAAEKIVDSKVTCAAPETTASSKPDATKPEGAKDEPSVSSASRSVETAAATSTAKRRETNDENQNKKDGEKKSKFKSTHATFVFVLNCSRISLTHFIFNTYVQRTSPLSFSPSSFTHRRMEEARR